MVAFFSGGSAIEPQMNNDNGIEGMGKPNKESSLSGTHESIVAEA